MSSKCKVDLPEFIKDAVLHMSCAARYIEYMSEFCSVLQTNLGYVNQAPKSYEIQTIEHEIAESSLVLLVFWLKLVSRFLLGAWLLVTFPALYRKSSI